MIRQLNFCYQRKWLRQKNIAALVRTSFSLRPLDRLVSSPQQRSWEEAGSWTPLVNARGVSISVWVRRKWPCHSWALSPSVPALWLADKISVWLRVVAPPSGAPALGCCLPASATTAITHLSSGGTQLCPWVCSRGRYHSLGPAPPSPLLTQTRSASCSRPQSCVHCHSNRTMTIDGSRRSDTATSCCREVNLLRSNLILASRIITVSEQLSLTSCMCFTRICQVGALQFLGLWKDFWNTE